MAQVRLILPSVNPNAVQAAQDMLTMDTDDPRFLEAAQFVARTLLGVAEALQEANKGLSERFPTRELE